MSGATYPTTNKPPFICKVPISDPSLSNTVRHKPAKLPSCLSVRRVCYAASSPLASEASYCVLSLRSTLPTRHGFAFESLFSCFHADAKQGDPPPFTLILFVDPLIRELDAAKAGVKVDATHIPCLSSSGTPQPMCCHSSARSSHMVQDGG
jgi:hypothetical protein